MQNKTFGVGIDLGTTKHSIGVWMNNSFQIIENEEGFGSTPSYIAFTENEILIGEAAKNQAARNPLNTIFDINRMIGRTFHDPQIQQDLKFWPFQIEQGPQDKIVIVVKTKGIAKKFYPEDLQAMFIKKLKQSAEKFLKQEIKYIVLTVELTLNILQFQSLYKSINVAGLQCIRIIKGSVSSFFTHFYDSNLKIENKFLVISFGGGSLSTSLIDFEDQVIEVHAFSENDHLGGQDFDNKLIEHCCAKFLQNKGIDIKLNPRSISRLRNECEKAKRTLSSANQAIIEVDGLFENEDFSLTINRSDFEDLCLPLFNLLIRQVKQLLFDGFQSKRYIEEVLLVGESIRIPKVVQLLKDYFANQLNFKHADTNSALKGSAIYASLLNGSLKNDSLILNSSAYSVGVETDGGVMKVIIPRNTTIPVKRSKMVSTTIDNQKGILIQIYQGERSLTKDCIKCGQFKLDGIQTALKGVPKIEITFDIDENNTIQVFAKDLNSQKEKLIDTQKDNLFNEEISILDRENWNIQLYEYQI
ncbi:hypothetical protein pb186bvf_010234 [Paramecium bursaria]